jgi:hypothetical protein
VFIPEFIEKMSKALIIRCRMAVFTAKILIIAEPFIIKAMVFFGHGFVDEECFKTNLNDRWNRNHNIVSPRNYFVYYAK